MSHEYETCHEKVDDVDVSQLQVPSLSLAPKHQPGCLGGAVIAQEKSDLKWFQSGKTRGTCIVKHHVLNYVSMCWLRSTYMPPFFCLVPTPLLAEIKMKSDWIVSF